jgi:hypothetical protein
MRCFSGSVPGSRDFLVRIVGSPTSESNLGLQNIEQNGLNSLEEDIIGLKNLNISNFRASRL